MEIDRVKLSRIRHESAQHVAVLRQVHRDMDFVLSLCRLYFAVGSEASASGMAPIFKFLVCAVEVVPVRAGVSLCNLCGTLYER